MKKIISVLLIIAMMFSFVACNDSNKPSNGDINKDVNEADKNNVETEVDPKVVYENALKKNNELDSMEALSKINMHMTYGEESMDMLMNLNLKISDTNTENMKYLVETKTSAMGQDINMVMYYEDGYLYMDTSEQKIKYAIDADSIIEQFEGNTENTAVDSQYLEDVKLVKDKDNSIITYSLSSEEINNLMQGIFDQMGTDVIDMSTVNYTVKETTGETTVDKDGYITNTKLKMSFDMAVENEEISMDMELSMDYVNPGQKVSIDTPDLEGYIEVDSSLIAN